MNQKVKNIAFITPDFPPNLTGGCGISSSLLVGQLRQLGYWVDVYCFNYFQEVIVTNNGNNYYFKGAAKIPFLNNLAALYRLKNKLSGYDIVHVYNMGLIPAVALVKGKQCKLVATINNPKGALATTYMGHVPLINRISNFLTTNAIKLFRNKVDGYIALTQALKNLYVQQGYDGSRISVIQNMYDPIFLKPPSYQKPADKIILLYSGQLGDNKGVLDLLKAFSAVKKKYSEVHLKILGKGKHKDAIANYVKKYRLEDRVTLIYKPYPNVRYEYFTSDILIHPAKWFEPFSRVWLEAMCANLFIVSSNNPSAVEVLKENTIFYNQGDKNELINAIDKAVIMAKNKPIAYTALPKYSPKIVVNNIIKFYRQL